MMFLVRVTAALSQLPLATCQGQAGSGQGADATDAANLHLNWVHMRWKVDSLVSIKSTRCHPRAVLHAGKYITMPAAPAIQFHSIHFEHLRTSSGTQRSIVI